MNLHVHVSDLSFSAEFPYDQYLLLEIDTFVLFDVSSTCQIQGFSNFTAISI